MITRLITSVLFCFCLSVASAANLDVKEIRFQGIGGYSQNRFTSAIRSDGTVQYTGVSFVAVEGNRLSRISPEDFKKLVTKIEQIHFFKLEDHYDQYPLDESGKVSGNEATAVRTFVTDQRTEIVTVVTNNRTKSVKDYMGAPKALFEFEQLILDLTHARTWSGDVYDRDVPYYNKFPLNSRVTYRVLLANYRTSGDRRRVSGQILMFVNNKGIQFDVESSQGMNLSKLNGYLVDATGQIRETSHSGYKFVLAKVRPVRRYSEIKS